MGQSEEITRRNLRPPSEIYKQSNRGHKNELFCFTPTTPRRWGRKRKKEKNAAYGFEWRNIQSSQKISPSIRKSVQYGI